MALTDKNIVITPNIGQTADPKIVFSGADATTGAQNITLQVYPTNNGTLSFEGTNGQLFSINNNFTGTIFSVNDISGIPSIEVLDTGEVRLAQYSGFVHIPNTTNATNTTSGALQVDGGVGIGGNTWIGGNLTVIGLITGNVSLSGTITTASNIALGSAGQLIYQSASGVTAFAGPGTAGQVLLSNGTSGPVYTNTASIYVNSSVYAEEIRGGTAGQLLYQSAANSTNYVGAGTSGQLLVSQGASASGPVFTNTASIYVGNSVLTEKILGGVAGAVVYQSGANATAFSGAGTNGQVLLSGGTGSPTWSNTLNLAGTTAATSTSTGALVVAGGAGIGGNLYVGGTLYATVSGNITTATNVAGGATGSILMQTAAGQTGFIGIGTNGYTLKSNGTTATWVDPATMVSGIANTATNIAGGAANQIPYQSGVGLTTFSSNFTYNGTNFTVGSGVATAYSFVPSSATVPTNGMYLPAANLLGFATNSGGKLFIDSAGNVGVGTNAPLTRLDVRYSNGSTQAVQVNGMTLRTNEGGGLEWHLAHSNGYTGWAAAARINNNGSSWGQAYLEFITASSSGGAINPSVLTLTGLNTTGFGTNSPRERVDIANGKLYVEGGGAVWDETTQGLGRGSIHIDPGITTNFGGGAITFGAVDSGNGETSQGGIYVKTSGSYGTKMYLATSNSYATGAQTRVFIGHDGLVGINTTSPGARLHVVASAINNGGAAVPAGTAAIIDTNGNNFLTFRTTTDNSSYEGIVMQDNNIGGYVVYGGGGTGETLYCSGYSAIEMRIGAASTTLPSDRTRIGLFNTNGLTITGNGYFTGNVYSSYSDINLKTVLGKIENPLDIVRSIETFYYEPNELALKLGAAPGRQVGVSAQSVQKKMGEVVGESPINKEYLTVQYERLVPVLLESVKALEDLVKAQEEKIKQLEEKLNGTLPR